MDEQKSMEALEAAQKDMTDTAAPETGEKAPEEAAVPNALASDPKEPYVERPKGQRIFAWVLFGIIIAGVLLYYFWIAKGGRL